MKKLVIVPRENMKNLFSTYRQEGPFQDVKFITKEEFIASISYDYTSEAILYLIEKYHFDFNLASKFLREMRFINSGTSPKIVNALKIKNDLLNRGLLITNPYFDYELKKSEIHVYNYAKNDPELAYFLKNYPYQYRESEIQKDLKIDQFDNFEDEIFYVINEIAGLLDQGVSPKDIYIFGLDTNIDLTILRILDNFGINLNNYSYKTLFDLVFVKEFLNRFSNEEDFETLIVDIKERYSEDINFKKFFTLVKAYHSSVLNKDEQVLLYLDIFKRMKATAPNYENAIRCLNEPFAPKGSHLFIVNMTAGNFPHTKKDDGYFFEIDLEGVEHPTLKEKNNALSDLYISAFSKDVNLHLSYSLRKDDTVKLSSHLVKQLEMDIIKKHTTNAIFSYDEAKIKYALALDIKKNYRAETDMYLALKNHINIPYLNYDNSYKGTEHYIGYQSINLSYSQAKVYFECAFKYYLTYIMKLDNDETSYYLVLGNIAHSIYENIESGKSFDELFEEFYNKYSGGLTAKDKAFLKINKPHIEFVFNYIKKFEGQIYNPAFERELPLKTKVSDNVYLNGKIDKLILSGAKQEYITVIDYKTGKEEFKADLVEYGLSLQLPTYIYLLENSAEYNAKNILGIFIEPALNQKGATMKMGETDYLETLKLKGIFLNDLEALKSIDSSLEENSKSSYVLGATLLANKVDFKQPAKGFARFVSPEWFDRTKELAEKLYLDAGTRILNNEFPINPKMYMNKNKSCEYCSFRDICYRKNRNFVTLKDGEGDEDDGE